MSTDSDLLSRIRARDRGGVAELYDRHAPRLFAVALRILGDQNAAAEALEETFIRLWEKAGTDDWDADPAAWLVRQTRERSLAQQGRTASTAVHPNEATPRQVLEDAYYGGLTVAELSGKYGLRAEQIRGLVHREMEELRTQFAAGSK